MRPTKLTDELADALCSYLEEGFSIRSACVQEDVDMHPTTVFRWLARGRSVTRGKYFDFVQRTERARACGAARLEARFYAAALEGDPKGARACDAALKTLYREWYGAKVEVTGANGGPVSHEVTGANGGALEVRTIIPNEDQALEIARILQDVLPTTNDHDEDTE